MKKIIIFMIVVTILTLLSANTFAATNTVEMVLDVDMESCIFTVAWENGEQTADIEIVSPSGKKFGNLLTPNQTTVSEGAVYINVGTASAGTWNVVITGTALGRVDVYAGQLPDAMTIDMFRVEKTADGYNAYWSISQASENLKVDIYADTNASGYDGIKAASFSTNSVGEGSFSLRNIDNGHYFFYMKAYDNTGVFDYKYTEAAILHENANSAEKLEKVEAYVVNGDIFISWNGTENQYRVMLLDANTFEMLYDETTSDNSHIMAFPEGHGDLWVAAASYVRNKTGKYDLYKVSKQSLPDADVIYPEESVTNKTPIFADITMNGDYIIQAALNEVMLLDGGTQSGKYEIPLIEGDNSIVFIISDADGNKRTFLKEIYLDSKPPQLTINSDINGLKTPDSFIYIDGYTEAGTELYFNNNLIETVNGHFSARYDLSFGRNKIVISAIDIAGNESLYTAIVHREFFTPKTIRWIVLIVIAVLLVTVETVILIKGVKRRNNEKDKGN